MGEATAVGAAVTEVINPAVTLVREGGIGWVVLNRPGLSARHCGCRR